MADTLTQQQCTACKGNSPPASEEEIKQFMPQIPGWQMKEKDGEFRLERRFDFQDFRQALLFTRKVGEQAEAEGHHPVLLTEWGKVTVTWWTHAINGLHKNDFIMAAKTDQIADQFSNH